MSVINNDTICALSTPAGKGGIAVVRISGDKVLELIEKAWEGPIITKPRHSYFGKYFDRNGNQLDEILLTFFKGPASFTGEDTIEISMHGSTWIQQRLVNDLIERGARLAAPGEFTQRAFLNGKLDLARAEGVADLIASESGAAHKIALSQMKGEFSKELSILRNRLIEFASLLELELDFSEEDVEFANRENLKELAAAIINKINALADSYASGRSIKEGIPVVIAGIPNAGKSSLLNLISGDEKAIVTDIPGTTRDLIEEKIEINGILYRFIDTAGIRATEDKVESIGVDRARNAINKAKVIIWMFDLSVSLAPQILEMENSLREVLTLSAEKDSRKEEQPCIGSHSLKDIKAIEQLKSSETDRSDNLREDNFLKSVEAFETDRNLKLIVLANKSDLNNKKTEIDRYNAIPFSTKTGEGFKTLMKNLHNYSTSGINETSVIVTNARHYESLVRGSQSLTRALNALNDGITADFIAQDIREALHHLGTITGTITTPDLLHSIFSRFCIGK